MAESKLKNLLDRGKQAAKHADWRSSRDYFQQAVNLAPQNIAAVNGLASSLLQLGQTEEAIGYYKKLINLLPQSADAYNNLGVAQMIAGQFEKSEQAYRQAVELDPEHVQAWKNLAIVCLKQNKMEEGVQILASLVKAYPEDVESLYLLGQCYQGAEEYESARYLYEEALKIDPEFGLVKEALASLPVVGIDTSRIARAEHASKLSALKSLKQGNKKETPKVGIGEKERDRLFDRGKSVAFFGLKALPGGRRVALMARLLAQLGYRTEFSESTEEDYMRQYDYFVFSQPHISPDLINGVMRCIQNGIPYALDIDQDYHNLPEDHPAYMQFGQGNPKGIQALNIMLQEAAWVSTPSTMLARRLKSYAKKVVVIPPMWDRENPLWEKPKPRHSQINLGWLGTAIDAVDLLSIQKELETCLDNSPNVQLVIAGDLSVFEKFEGIPETRRLFLPPPSPEDIPYVLSQFDVLLIPLRDNPFNQAISDMLLLEAGVLRIPWLASPVQAYQEWGEGGLLVDKGGWCEAIAKLVNDENLRIELGRKGREKAEKREKEIMELFS